MTETCVSRGGRLPWRNGLWSGMGAWTETWAATGEEEKAEKEEVEAEAEAEEDEEEEGGVRSAERGGGRC
jgi:hypothetical protein